MKKERIWELDILRGFAFILMVFDHLCFDLGFIFKSLYTNPTLLKICDWCFKYTTSDAKKIINALLCWSLFVLISGISSSFSHNNLRRGLKVLAIAGAFSIGVFVFNLIFKLNVSLFFGILHCLGICMIMTPLLNKLKTYQLTIIGVSIIIIYIFTRNITTEYYFLLPFIKPDNKFPLMMIDYQPLLPRLGIYIIGMVIGRTIYNNKKSLFEKEHNIPFLTFLGKNTLWLYFVHQVVLIVVLTIGILIK